MEIKDKQGNVITVNPLDAWKELASNPILRSGARGLGKQNYVKNMAIIQKALEEAEINEKKAKVLEQTIAHLEDFRELNRNVRPAADRKRTIREVREVTLTDILQDIADSQKKLAYYRAHIAHHMIMADVMLQKIVRHVIAEQMRLVAIFIRQRRKKENKEMEIVKEGKRLQNLQKQLAKIQKHRHKFYYTCEDCGCKFTFIEPEVVYYDRKYQIKCPQCGTSYIVPERWMTEANLKSQINALNNHLENYRKSQS